MNSQRFAAFLAELPVIAILRGVTPPEIPGVCDALAEAGIGMLEITLNSPDAITGIQLAVDHCRERQLVGAGTVLSPTQVRSVHAAGGRFVISPDTNVDVIRETVRLGMVSIPGFLTPSEAFAALRAGADYLKLFPAAAFGPGYVKDIKAVIKAPIFAVGGIDAHNIPVFLKTCDGVGVGGSLYRAGKPLDALAADAADIVRAVRGE